LLVLLPHWFGARRTGDLLPVSGTQWAY
jgi:hypothetical protein